MPLLFEYPTAAEIPESGTGITTSASAGASSASDSPIRPRAPATSLPSKRESGRAEYTYSKTQRDLVGLSTPQLLNPPPPPPPAPPQGAGLGVGGARGCRGGAPPPPPPGEGGGGGGGGGGGAHGF